jgi:iron(III) transport system permease protein
MGRWRLGVALILLAAVALPLLGPLLRLSAEPGGWRSWADAERFLALGRNTALLVGATLAFCLPAGVVAAVLLYRTDLPLRRALRFVTVLTLFVPLPLFATGWQAVLGSGTLTPWGEGIIAAAWIHALAGLPWVVLLVGQALCWVERDLEEDALTVAGPLTVLWRVTLPRCGAALGVAAVWVGLQAASEITITDPMQVRTFAEEVYTQFVLYGEKSDPVAHATAVALPAVIGLAALLVVLARRWEQTLPPRADLLASPLLFPLGRWRLPLAVLAAVGAAVLLAVPAGGLVWRVGLSGGPPAWTAEAAWRQLARAGQTEGRRIAESLLVAAGAGLACAALALVACWAARAAPRFRATLLVLMAVAWAAPGPVIGLGLKALIEGMLRRTGDCPPLPRLLWHGPSYAPVVWVDLIRFFPYAVAVLWPVMRLLPDDLLDAARVDGARPAQELRHVVAPLTAAAWLRAALVVAVLALGEVSAGKLVSTPGAPTYAQEVFAQMHFGVTAHLAGQCLWLLVVVAAGGALVAALSGAMGARSASKA